MATRKAEHVRYLNEVLDEIFTESDRQNLTLQDLVSLSGLSITTLYRYDYRLADRPQFESIRRLARAVGMEIMLHRVTTQKLRNIA